VIDIVGEGGDVQEIVAALGAEQRDVAFAPASAGPPQRSGPRIGTLMFASREPISGEDEALLRRAAPVLALILAAQAAAENEVWRDRGAWLRAALAGPDDAPDAGRLPGVRPNRTWR
jgi:hypothetical protein